MYVQAGAADASTFFSSGRLPVARSPAVPAFSAYISSNQYIYARHNTMDGIAYDVEDFDTSNSYSTSTGIFKPSVAGYYQFNFNFNYRANWPRRDWTGRQTYVFIMKNGGKHVAGSLGTDNTGGGNANGVGSALIYMNGAGDYVQVGLVQCFGDVWNYMYGDSSKSVTDWLSRFSGFLVRAA